MGTLQHKSDPNKNLKADSRLGSDTKRSTFSNSGRTKSFDTDTSEDEEAKIEEPLLIRGFSNSKRSLESPTESSIVHEGWCYIRNTEDRFKKYWCFIKGKELFCQKQKDSDKVEVMHLLVNTFVSEAKPFLTQDQTMSLYPVKISLAKTKIRILYFDSMESSTEWV